MAKDFGDALSASTSIPPNRTKPFTNTIGGDDRRDFLKVKLSTRSSLNTTLSKFKGNVRLALLNESGNVLQTASPSGKKRLINTILDAGNYIVRLVSNGPDSTSYRLKVNTNPTSSVPGNTVPAVSINTGIGLARGGLVNLNGSLLKVTDAQQSASELIYTLTGRPTAGQLKLNGNLLGIGGTFTQADIDAGRISYVSRSSINQLTQNALEEDDVVVSEDAIAYQRYDGLDYEISLFDGNTTIPLTNNAVNDNIYGKLSGKKLAWHSPGGTDGGTDNEIFYYDGSTVRQLTTNNTDDYGPQVSGSNVIWEAEGGSDGGTDYEIFFYNGTSTLQLTTNSKDDYGAHIFGSNITWEGLGGSDGGTDTEIFFYNGTSSQQLTTNSTNDYEPRIFGSNITWEGVGGTDGGTDNEIFFYNGTLTRQITTNNTNDYNPRISGSNITWEGIGGSDGGTDREIFFYNGTSTRQITTNNTNDYDPQISRSNVIWEGVGGSDGGTDREIFFYNGTSTRQITQNDVQDYNPQIAGDLYAWYGQGGTDGGTDFEVFYGSAVTSDRFSFTVSDGAGGSTAGSFVFNIS